MCEVGKTLALAVGDASVELLLGTGSCHTGTMLTGLGWHGIVGAIEIHTFWRWGATNTISPGDTRDAAYASKCAALLCGNATVWLIARNRLVKFWTTGREVTAVAVPVEKRVTHFTGFAAE